MAEEPLGGGDGAASAVASASTWAKPPARRRRRVRSIPWRMYLAVLLLWIASIVGVARGLDLDAALLYIVLSILAGFGWLLLRMKRDAERRQRRPPSRHRRAAEAEHADDPPPPSDRDRPPPAGRDAS